MYLSLCKTLLKVLLFLNSHQIKMPHYTIKSASSRDYVRARTLKSVFKPFFQNNLNLIKTQTSISWLHSMLLAMENTFLCFLKIPVYSNQSHGQRTQRGICYGVPTSSIKKTFAVLGRCPIFSSKS